MVKKISVNSYLKQRNSFMDIRNSFLSKITRMSPKLCLLSSWDLNEQCLMKTEFYRTLLSRVITNIMIINIMTTKQNTGSRGA